jgi:transcriptional regulator with PAS, ATPase and Fis domain
VILPGGKKRMADRVNNFDKINKFSEEKNVEEVLDAIQDSIIVVNKDYQLAFVNQAALNTLDIHDKEGVVGEICYKVFLISRILVTGVIVMRVLKQANLNLEGFLILIPLGT